MSAHAQADATGEARVNCQICGAETEARYTATLLKKYEAIYHYCAACDHLYVANPTWLDEAYSDAIVHHDTDVAVRNLFTALRLAAFYYWVLGERGQGRYVDVAGGYGLLTRLMRDLGFDCYWSDRYAKNLFARGFDVTGATAARAISAIEVLEHTTNPLEFIRDNLADQRAEVLVFTTELFPDHAPPPPARWGYYSLGTGQHIAFFSRTGLTRLATRLGMHYYPMGRLHVFSRRPLSRWRIMLARRKMLVVPLALFAAWRLGSKRNRDQRVLRERARQNEA